MVEVILELKSGMAIASLTTKEDLMTSIKKEQEARMDRFMNSDDFSGYHPETSVIGLKLDKNGKITSVKFREEA